MPTAQTKPLQSSKRKKSPAQGKFEQLLWGDKTNIDIERYPFAEISPHLRLRHHARAKRLALRLDVKNRLVYLTIPKRISVKAAYKFALENQNWITDRLEELPKKVTLGHGALIPLFGQEYQVHITCDKTLRKTNISLKDNKLIVLTNKENPEARIKRFVISHTLEELSKLAHEKAAILGKKIKNIDVKDTASRWGSCSQDGCLSFSWRLAFASPEAYDYVVAHEVAHLNHMDHSPAFWKQCAALSDNYVRGKAWMKINAQELLRYC